MTVETMAAKEAPQSLRERIEQKRGEHVTARGAVDDQQKAIAEAEKQDALGEREYPPDVRHTDREQLQLFEEDLAAVERGMKTLLEAEKEAKAEGELPRGAHARKRSCR